WLVEQQRSCDEEEGHKLQSCLGRSETLLQPNRELRRQCKQHQPDTLYREGLQFELQLEKHQQADLVECINTLALRANHTEPLTQIYCRHLGAAHLYAAFKPPSAPLAKAS
ncbi:TIGR02444 family protein, partial [Vibrio sp. S234-5]|uniref:TIGR02444 family protein n=1 Tax=Vibrio sp. S234-5 TaxID=1616781 RepID=UPI0005EEA2D8